MNVKFGIKVTKKYLEYWLKYIQDSGYKVTKKTYDANSFVYMADVPGHYGSETPIAEAVKTDRWKYWINIRIPLKDDVPLADALERHIQSTQVQMPAWAQTAVDQAFEAEKKSFKLHYYEFRHRGHPEEYVPVISSWDSPEKVRKNHNWDHGGMDYEIFNKLLTEGYWSEIHSINDVEEPDVVPYVTWENTHCSQFGPATGPYAGKIDHMSILEFFEEYYGKEFNKDV